MIDVDAENAAWCALEDRFHARVSVTSAAEALRRASAEALRDLDDAVSEMLEARKRAERKLAEYRRANRVALIFGKWVASMGDDVTVKKAEAVLGELPPLPPTTDQARILRTVRALTAGIDFLNDTTCGSSRIVEAIDLMTLAIEQLAAVEIPDGS